MDQKEIDRIKQGVFHASQNIKGPANQILKDLEVCVLTVEALSEKLRLADLQNEVLKALLGRALMP